MPKIPRLKQLTESDLKPLRRRLYNQQNSVCPIFGKKCAFDDTVVDHQHMTAKETVGVDGAGLIRGVIHFQANALEGKIANAYKRWGIHKHGVTLPEFLRNLADYLERKPLNLIHPNEKPKPKVLGKRVFNKINKAYVAKYPRRKPLEYPKGRGRKRVPYVTPRWEKLMAEFKITG